MFRKLRGVSVYGYGLSLPSWERNEPLDDFVITHDPVLKSIKGPADIAVILEARGCKDITSHLELKTCTQKPLSGGGYGDIYRGVLTEGTRVAIKTIREYNSGVDETECLAKELYAWSKCKHPNVAELLGWATFNKSIAMVSRWMDKGNLLRFLEEYPNADRYSLSASICKGLEYLHSENIIHGDLKAVNVLVADDGVPVLIDFGNSKVDNATLQFTKTRASRGYSPRWAAPEIFQETSAPTKAGDIYALGMTILEVFTGKIPYLGKSDQSLYMHVVQHKQIPLRPEANISSRDSYGDQLWNLLVKCWSYDPVLRPSAHEVCAVVSELADLAEIRSLPRQERLDLAADLMSRGDAALWQQNPECAVDLYTQGMRMTVGPKTDFYVKRAVGYTNFQPPQYQKAIEDCTQALELDSKCVDALHLRATALEATGNLKDALRDFMARAIIECIENNEANAAVDRAILNLSAQQAEKIIREEEPVLPGITTLSMGFAWFRKRPNVVLPVPSAEGDRKLLEAQEALHESRFSEAHELVNVAMDSGLSEHWKEGLAEALNLRGTFKHLMGDTTGAKADFLASTQAWPDLVHSWVKLATMCVKLNEHQEAFIAFESAIEKDPDCADIYYHRGEAYSHHCNFVEAIEDYRRSSELDPTFVWPLIQLAETQRKMGNIESWISTYRTCFRKFPDRVEPYLYCGIALAGQWRYQDAIERFDKAIEIGKQNSCKQSLFASLPLVMKAIAVHDWKQDLGPAIQLCEQALVLDDKNDLAVGSLAQFLLEQGRVEWAAEMFTKLAILSRDKARLVQAFSYQNAWQAQLEFQNNYPDMAGQIN